VGRRRQLALAVLTLLALALGAGCGSSDATPEPEPEGRVLSAQQISDEFEDEAGRPLQEAAPDPSWEQLGLGLNPPPAVLDRFGTFSIYVVDDEDPEALESLLRDKATGEPLEMDVEGIYWERDSLSNTWIAHSRYGENVVLAWFSEQREPETDERWERLDEILSGLASG
jgi:hypothetical protein